MNLKPATLLAVSLLLSGSAVMAQTATPAPDYTLSYSASLVSDYRIRGLSQTSFKPALLATVDWTHKSGIYLGAFGSNINWIRDYVGAPAKGSLEIDLYAGYRGSITQDIGFDIGAIRYQYPGNTASKVTVNANTTELYGALSYGIFTAKYSQSTGNFVANPDSAGSKYLELAANIDLGSGLTLTPHIGHQKIPNVSFPQPDSGNYTDYSLTLAKDFGNGLSASVSAIGTNAKDGFYKVRGIDNLGKSAVVVGLKYSF